ncbi:hypothetical protein [Cryobacterium sp. Y82]|uniref:hypothetical protein n=1 Tax=Cryobacterium sp. Y82 TaxID=2045017 RepID=UPI000CE31295|nr:hypothetical protein [Cryobacterium sp. Y82]
MTPSSSRGRRLRYAAAAFLGCGIVVLILIVVMAAPPRSPDQTVAASPVVALTSQPRDVVFEGVPVVAYIGAYSGQRAVVHLQGAGADAEAAWASVVSAQLSVSEGDIPAEISVTRSADGLSALTLEFTSSQPIGKAALLVTTSNREYRFDCRWSTIPGG